MKQEINFTNIIQSIVGAARAVLRFHYLIFITFMVIGVFFAFYSITNILNLPEDTTYKEELQKNNINDTFDESTINKIDQLQFSDDASPPPLPSGRTNPFAE